MSTIKINELATADISLSDFFAKSDANGIAKKNTIQNLINILEISGDLSFKGSLAIADTPSLDGWYFASETGTYTNTGELVVNIDSNLVIIIVSGTQTVFEKIDIPVTITKDALPEAGSTNAVESQGIVTYVDNAPEKLNEILSPTENSNEIYNDTNTTTTTTLETIVNIVEGQRYLVNVTSSDTLSSGLLLIATDPGVSDTTLKTWDSSTDFASGVSFEFTSDIDGILKFRTFISGVSIDFVVTEKEYVSQLTEDVQDLNTLIETKKIVDEASYVVSTTGVFGDFPVSKYAGQKVTVFIEAPYTGNFALYSKNKPYTTLTTILVISSINFTSGYTLEITLPSDANLLAIRTYTTTTLTNFEVSLPVIKDVFLSNENQHSGTNVGMHGDSIIADAISTPSETNLTAPFTDESKWATFLGNNLDLSKIYIRGIGGQKYAWGTAGGSVSFVNADGTIHSRDDAYNYDNYSGNIPTPSGTTASRSAFCSWLRITLTFPASIKDDIDTVLIMGATNDANDSTQVSFVASDTTDTEWVNSTEYSDYNGDYNISTLKGGIASTIMKFQAWMPNATIIVATPLGGRSSGAGQINTDPFTEEFYKAEYVREVLKAFNIPLVDVHAYSGVNGLNSPTYITDGIHPYNEAGRKALANCISGEMVKIYPIN